MCYRQHKETIQICKHMLKNRGKRSMIRNGWYGFTKGKFCQTNMIALYGVMIGTVGKKKAVR